MDKCAQPERASFLLTPAQGKAARELEQAIMTMSAGRACMLEGEDGRGKTSVLRRTRERTGGVHTGAAEFLDILAAHHPQAIEEAFLSWIRMAFAADDIVFVDDLHLIARVTDSCDYPRSNLLDLAISAALDEAEEQGKRLIFALSGVIPDPLMERSVAFKIEEFKPEDFRAICTHHLAQSSELDFDQIFRFAPGISGHQLVNASIWAAQQPELTTQGFIDYLSSRNLISNVDTDEVEAVSWSDLKGVDEVIAELETKIALPFENTTLAAELQLKPKRGVLLAGPPGTGKTTIGRALAHRLKSKFFLLDGTAISGTSDFYHKIDRVFARAKRNAPAIVFIDDADVIFQGEKEQGLYRYLLTMMDGLESASAGRVCVMMTAMDAANLPPALVRSGRVELWLETKLPDQNARVDILRDRLAGLPAPFCELDLTAIASASSNFTGADLKAAVEDAKLLFAQDKTKGKPLRPIEEYFLEAIATIIGHRKTYHTRRRSNNWTEVKFGYEVINQ